MAHVDVLGVGYTLPDGRPLLTGVDLRVGDGAKVALIGPNGVGKTTLARIVAGAVPAHEGAVVRSGELAVMPQFIGSIRDSSTVRDLLLRVAPERIRATADALARAERALAATADEATQLTYAQALTDWADAGGYSYETVWDVCTQAALRLTFDAAQHRPVTTLSGGEQKRLVLEALLRGPAQLLLLDEPDNYLDVPAKRWLEQRLVESAKSVLFVSHDRELLDRVATRVATLEPGAAGATVWVHAGRFAQYADARRARVDKLEERRRRWTEEHAKLKALVVRYRQKASYNDEMASRLKAAVTRLRQFEEAGPPPSAPPEQNVRMRLRGGRTAKRAVVCTDLQLTGLMQPFATEIWYGERVAVLGSNGSGKSHFLRLLAAGGSDPEPEHLPVSDVDPGAIAHTGTARLGSRVRPGWFAQTHEQPAFVGRTLVEILHRGDDHRPGMGREDAGRVLDRYELARQAEQTFETLSGGQQARFQILMLELRGATLLLLDEPTDNLDLHSAEALEAVLGSFEGTVVAVTHDRWFARGFDRFLVFGGDGEVYEADEPVWSEQRVRRAH